MVRTYILKRIRETGSFLYWIAFLTAFIWALFTMPFWAALYTFFLVIFGEHRWQGIDESGCAFAVLLAGAVVFNPDRRLYLAVATRGSIMVYSFYLLVLAWTHLQHGGRGVAIAVISGLGVLGMGLAILSAVRAEKRQPEAASDGEWRPE